MQRKIGAYIRVSTEEQANAIEGSLQNQEYRLKSYVDMKNIQEKGWGKISDFYIDDGFSAKDTNRPAYQRMMADLKKGKIDLILVADLSRLSRNLFDFCGLLEFLDLYKASFLSIKEQFDTSTPVGRMIIYIIITLAQFEREQTSERVALGVHARAMRGLLNGGRAVMGFDKDPAKPGVYVVNPVEAKKVVTVFETYLEAGSKTKAIELLKEKLIVPKVFKHFLKQKQTGEWTLDLLGTLLSNAAYIGFHEVNKGNKFLDQSTLKPNQKYQLVKASWPAIIPEDLFYSVQDQLEEAKSLERTRLDGAESRLYLLSGVFKCAECGGVLVGQTYHGAKSKYRYYGHTNLGAKNGCEIQRISADEVETVVLKYLKESLVKTGYFAGLKKTIARHSQSSSKGTSHELARAKSELQKLEIETSNIFNIQTQGSFGAEALKLMSERLEDIGKKKTALKTYLKTLEHQASESLVAGEAADYIEENIVDFENGFNKSAPGQKKRLIRKTIKQIALSKDSLALWFYTSAEDEEIPGRKLALVKSDGVSGTQGLALVSKPNQEVPCLDIRGNGDPGPN